MVIQVNLKGERYINHLVENTGLDRSFIEGLKESDREWDFTRPPPLTILPPKLFIRVFSTITGGVIAIILISVLAVFLLLRRMLNQVELITNNVRDIDEKGLHLRINLKGKDPISNMAKTFDGMLDKIESAFKSQKQFIQNASHELNTPLTVIKTKIDVLKQKKSVTGRQYRETIDLIDSEIMRLSKITEELLILSDLEDNREAVKKETIDLKGILNKILKLYENQIDAKNLKLIKNIYGVSKISGSRIQIEQLLFNLLDNAIKYSSPGERLKIDIKKNIKNNNTILEISNTTTALTEKDIPHIFERFYKSSSSDRKSFGLGLTIVKKIVENHKGNLKVSYSQVKKEVTFRIVFQS
jgi:signal transduction histidine kinase